MSRIILHIDMDAFFAAIEERERPELKGKPIVVGADPKGGRGRGVVSTASYAARKFGIHSAMPISQAWKLCPAPKCAYLPVDGRLYEIVSERVMRIIRACTTPNPSSTRRGNESISSPARGEARRGGSSVIEQVSIDEAYVDVSFCGSYEKAAELAQTIKHGIKTHERLSCSIGIGPNKLIAKIASDFQKPDGVTVVREKEAADFLAPMPIRRLPGIGPKTEMELQRIGIRTVRELRQYYDSIVGRGLVPRRGGGQAPTLHRLGDFYLKAQGIDDTSVVAAYEAKSLGHETTFAQDTRDQAILTHTLMELCDEVTAEVTREKVRFRTITVRVRFDNFETHTSAFTLSTPTDSVTILRQTALKLLFPYFKTKRLIRLIGVRVSKLTPPILPLS